MQSGNGQGTERARMSPNGENAWESRNKLMNQTLVPAFANGARGHSSKMTKNALFAMLTQTRGAPGHVRITACAKALQQKRPAATISVRRQRTSAATITKFRVRKLR